MISSFGVVKAMHRGSNPVCLLKASITVNYVIFRYQVVSLGMPLSIHSRLGLSVFEKSVDIARMSYVSLLGVYLPSAPFPSWPLNV